LPRDAILYHKLEVAEDSFASMAAIATAVDFPVSHIETEVLRLRGLMEKGQFAAALAGATALLEGVPENRDVWYVIAVSQRYLQRIPDALATLERLEKIHPDYSRLFQERGHCYVALREAEPAIQAFLRAVNINPSLHASWNGLKVLCNMSCRPKSSRRPACSPTARSSPPSGWCAIIC
jgi:tetratricopeptide (TPR) repeat protein